MRVVQQLIDKEGVDIERMLVLAPVLWQTVEDLAGGGLPLVDQHDNGFQQLERV